MLSSIQKGKMCFNHVEGLKFLKFKFSKLRKFLSQNDRDFLFSVTEHDEGFSKYGSEVTKLNK